MAEGFTPVDNHVVVIFSVMYARLYDELSDLECGRN